MKLLNESGSIEQSQDFDPRKFVFSNPDTEDFSTAWNGTPYTFTAMTTSPFFIVDANPQETNEIRKKFALRLAQRMYGKSKEYKQFEKLSEGKPTPMYYDPAKAYQPFVDMCLKPLPESKMRIGRKDKKEITLKIDPKTKKPVVRIYGEDDQDSTSLIAEAETAE